MSAPLDSSLKDRIANPSQTFKDFLKQYFLAPMYYIRQEYDLNILDRLTGDERAVAVEMIRVNLPLGYDHVFAAAERFGMSVVPTLQRSLATESDPYARYELAVHLYRAGAIDSSQMLEFAEAAIRDPEAWACVSNVLYFSYQLPLDGLMRLTNLALRTPEYDTRAAGYNAVNAIVAICKNGGVFTEALGSEILEQRMSRAAMDAPGPSYYEELQYFVGDKIYTDKDLFEKRLAELWARTRP